MIFSFSFLDRFYNVCPEQARRDFVTKDYKKPFLQVAGGIDDHRALESRIKHGEGLPPGASPAAEPMVRALEARGPIQAEAAFAVDKHLHPVRFFDNDRAWLRGKYDVVQRFGARAFIGDWKTGKTKEASDQLEIGALLLMESDPAVETVTGANLWLKAGKVGQPYTFTRAEKGARWAKWVGKMNAVEKLDPDKVWDKREGPLCNWCPNRECEHFTGRNP